MSNAPFMCPKCGAGGTMVMLSERQGGFSGGKAVVGAVIFGWVGGIIGGALGKRKVTYQCSKCGYIVEK